MTRPFPSLFLLILLMSLSACELIPEPDGSFNSNENIDALSAAFIDSSGASLCRDGAARVEVKGVIRKFKKGQNSSPSTFTFSSIPGRADTTVDCGKMQMTVEAGNYVATTYDQYGHVLVAGGFKALGSVGYVDEACNVVVQQRVPSARSIRINIMTNFRAGNVPPNTSLTAACL